jgi:hypothetical protein
MRSSLTSSTTALVRQNLHLVKQLYPGLQQPDFTALRSLTQAFHLSISKREILLIEGKWYVTHAGLLQIATRRRCPGIKFTVYKSLGSKGFVGYGDADPSNVSTYPFCIGRPVWMCTISIFRSMHQARK